MYIVAIWFVYFLKYANLISTDLELLGMVTSRAFL